MLAKPAVLLLGMIQENSKGAYEITKKLEQMNVRWWLKISDATIYSTLHTLEKKKYIKGKTEKNGNMPERTVYSITAEGTEALLSSIRTAFMKMDYDTTVFTVAASYISILSEDEIMDLLSMRLHLLEEYKNGIAEHISHIEKTSLPDLVIANINRMEDIIDAEIISANRMMSQIGAKYEKK